MSADPLNANPTILDAADLPTRRPRTSESSTNTLSSSIFSSVAPTYPADPFTPIPQGHISESDGDSNDADDGEVELIDEQEIFDLISTISDPEHPLSLGSLAVVSLPDIEIKRARAGGISTVTVMVTPTITHCSLATVIGLGVRVRLERALPARFRVDVRIKEGSHSTGTQVTKQLNDKERVAAALENGTLLAVLNKMLETCK